MRFAQGIAREQALTTDDAEALRTDARNVSASRRAELTPAGEARQSQPEPQRHRYERRITPS